MIATTHCERAWDVTSYRVSRKMLFQTTCLLLFGQESAHNTSMPHIGSNKLFKLLKRSGTQKQNGAFLYRFSTKRVNTGSFRNEYRFLSVPEYRYATLVLLAITMVIGPDSHLSRRYLGMNGSTDMPLQSTYLLKHKSGS